MKGMLWDKSNIDTCGDGVGKTHQHTTGSCVYSQCFTSYKCLQHRYKRRWSGKHTPTYNRKLCLQPVFYQLYMSPTQIHAEMEWERHTNIQQEAVFKASVLLVTHILKCIIHHNISLPIFSTRNYYMQQQFEEEGPKSNILYYYEFLQILLLGYMKYAQICIFCL